LPQKSLENNHNLLLAFPDMSISTFLEPMSVLIDMS